MLLIINMTALTERIALCTALLKARGYEKLMTIEARRLKVSTHLIKLLFARVLDFLDQS